MALEPNPYLLNCKVRGGWGSLVHCTCAYLDLNTYPVASSISFVCNVYNYIGALWWHVTVQIFVL